MLKSSFKWQYMARAGAEERDKGGAGAKNKYFLLRNTDLDPYHCLRLFSTIIFKINDVTVKNCLGPYPNRENFQYPDQYFIYLNPKHLPTTTIFF